MDDYMVNFEKIKRTMMGFAAFQTLIAGCRLKLFQALDNRPGLTRAQVAKAIGIEDHPARVLLLACCTYELTTRREDKYYNTAMTEQFLTERSVFPIVPFAEYCDVVQYSAFQALDKSLQQNTNAGLAAVPGEGDSLYKRLAQTPALERCFQNAMAPKDRTSRQFYFDTPEFREVKRLLDVGGGPGLIASLLKREVPKLSVTIFDLPTVCERAQAEFRQNGFKDMHTHPGDFFQDPFPRGFDAIQFSHLLEIFSEDKIVGLLKKAYDALDPGGRLFIYGMCSDDQETGADMAAWGSLYFFLLASGEGMMYPVADYRRWLKDVGFSQVIDRRNPFENMMVIATK